MEKSELEPKQVFNFTGYQIDLNEGNVRSFSQTLSVGSDNPNRPSGSYREASFPWLVPNDVNSVAPEKSLEDPGITR